MLGEVQRVWQELDYRIDIAASPRVDIPSTCKVGQKLGVSLPLLTCSPSAWSSGYCTAEVGNRGGTYELPCRWGARLSSYVSRYYLSTHQDRRREFTIREDSRYSEQDLKDVTSEYNLKEYCWHTRENVLRQDDWFGWNHIKTSYVKVTDMSSLFSFIPCFLLSFLFFPSLFLSIPCFWYISLSSSSLSFSFPF